MQSDLQDWTEEKSISDQYFVLQNRNNSSASITSWWAVWLTSDPKLVFIKIIIMISIEQVSEGVIDMKLSPDVGNDSCKEAQMFPDEVTGMCDNVTWVDWVCGRTRGPGSSDEAAAALFCSCICSSFLVLLNIQKPFILQVTFIRSHTPNTLFFSAVCLSFHGATKVPVFIL